MNGITYTVEHTADLEATWSSGSIVPVGDPVNNLDGTEPVILRLSTDIPSASRQFMRLKMTAAP